MDFRFDDRRDGRSHEKGDDEDDNVEDDILLSLLRLLGLMSMLLLLGWLIGVDALVVKEEEDDEDDDDDDMLLFPELAVDCLRLDSFHLPRLMMTAWVVHSSGYWDMR